MVGKWARAEDVPLLQEAGAALIVGQEAPARGVAGNCNREGFKFSGAVALRPSERN